MLGIRCVKGMDSAKDLPSAQGIAKLRVEVPTATAEYISDLGGSHCNPKAGSSRQK